jgi:hypothetical protein
MRYELIDLDGAHFARMLFVVKQDVFSDPLDVGLFGARGILLNANLVSKLVEQFFRFWGLELVHPLAYAT